MDVNYSGGIDFGGGRVKKADKAPENPKLTKNRLNTVLYEMRKKESRNKKVTAALNGRKTRRSALQFPVGV